MKKIAFITVFNLLILSQSCISMDNQPNTTENTGITSMIMNNLRHARDLTSYFFIKCYNVGVLATIYASLGMYDFNRISGLDENKLDTYSTPELEKAKQRIETMIQYSSDATKLQEFYSKIQGKLFDKQLHSDIDFNADETAALQELKTEINK